jgi:tetratricopeptide (TPR) repeat protein
MSGSARFLERAIDIGHGKQLALALVELGEIRQEMRDYRGAIEVLGRFAEMAEAAALPGPAMRARVFTIGSEGMISLGISVEESERRARALLVEAEALGDPSAIRAATIFTGRMAFFRGHCEEARAIALRLVPEVGSMNPMYRGLMAMSLGTAVYFGSVPVHEGYAMVDQIREILGDGPMSHIRGNMLLAGLTAMSGDTEGFFVLKDRIAQGWEEVGAPGHGKVEAQGLAESAWMLGEDEVAEAIMRDAKAALDAAGEMGNNSTVTGELATFLAEAGRFDEAAILVEEARAMTAPDDFGATVPIGWVDALLASARGDHDAALAAIDEAVRTVRTTDYLNFTADTLRIRGQLLSAEGRTDEAAASFDEAAALWTQKENVASLRRMQAWRDDHGV